VKFVLCSREDYVYAKKVLSQYALADRCQVLFSPAHDVLDPAVLADWILADRLPVRFQMQLHKVLWGDVAGR
jgi:7-carboxy-7-deazaguanine synthase